jgi:hypothetical protein
MPNTFNGTVTVSQKHKYSSTLDLDTAIHEVDGDDVFKLVDGEAINQAEVLFRDQRTLTASSNEELDLSGTSLQDAFGADIAFTSIKVMIIKAAIGNTNNVLFGGAAANAWSTWASDATDEVVVVPGGTLVLIAPTAAGYAVTAGTGDLLRIENSAGGTSVIYDLTLIGTEA